MADQQYYIARMNRMEVQVREAEALVKELKRIAEQETLKTRAAYTQLGMLLNNLYNKANMIEEGLSIHDEVVIEHVVADMRDVVANFYAAIPDEYKAAVEIPKERI